MKTLQPIIFGAFCVAILYISYLTMVEYWDYQFDILETQQEFELDKIDAQTDLVESITEILSHVEYKDTSGLDPETKVIKDLVQSLVPKEKNNE